MFWSTCFALKRFELLGVFVRAYAAEYHRDKGFGVVFNSEMFIKQVAYQISFRKGRRQQNVEGEAAEPIGTATASPFAIM